MVVRTLLTVWTTFPGGSVLATVAGLSTEASPGLGALDFSRLEGFLGLADGADRGAFGDGGDEPVALVVAAEELALVLALSVQQKQMAVGGLHVENGDLGLATSRSALGPTN